LRATLSGCAELEDRIAKMERDKGLFADEVGAVAAALDLKDGSDDIRQRVDTIQERVSRAGENARAEQRKLTLSTRRTDGSSRSRKNSSLTGVRLLP